MRPANCSKGWLGATLWSPRRLDVEPKLAGLDPTLGGELGLQQDQPQAEPGAAARSADDEVLWGGRVAVYVRGYSLESTRSRMVSEARVSAAIVSIAGRAEACA